MKASVAVYTPASSARFVYQLKSAEVSPAAYQTSSTSSPTWRMAPGRLPGEVWIASACGQLSAQQLWPYRPTGFTPCSFKPMLLLVDYHVAIILLYLAGM